MKKYTSLHTPITSLNTLASVNKNASAGGNNDMDVGTVNVSNNHSMLKSVLKVKYNQEYYNELKLHKTTVQSLESVLGKYTNIR